MSSWPAEGRIYIVPFVLNVNKVKNRIYNDDDDNNNNNNDNNNNNLVLSIFKSPVRSADGSANCYNCHLSFPVTVSSVNI